MQDRPSKSMNRVTNLGGGGDQNGTGLRLSSVIHTARGDEALGNPIMTE